MNWPNYFQVSTSLVWLTSWSPWGALTYSKPLIWSLEPLVSAFSNGHLADELQLHLASERSSQPCAGVDDLSPRALCARAPLAVHYRLAGRHSTICTPRRYRTNSSCYPSCHSDLPHHYSSSALEYPSPARRVRASLFRLLHAVQYRSSG